LAFADEQLFGVEGFDGEFVLTGDFMANVKGGIAEGTRALGTGYLGLTFDTEKLGWRTRGKLHVSTAMVTSNLTIQPDLQCIINPGMDRGLEDALVVGARMQLSF
jgi:carbohydrate-selective porin OprB